MIMKTTPVPISDRPAPLNLMLLLAHSHLVNTEFLLLDSSETFTRSRFKQRPAATSPSGLPAWEPRPARGFARGLAATARGSDSLVLTRFEPNAPHFTIVPVRFQRVFFMKSIRKLLFDGALSS